MCMLPLLALEFETSCLLRIVVPVVKLFSKKIIFLVKFFEDQNSGLLLNTSSNDSNLFQLSRDIKISVASWI